MDSAALGEPSPELVLLHDAVSLNLCSITSNKCVAHSHIILNSSKTLVGDIDITENLDNHSFIGSLTVDRTSLSPVRSSCRIIGREPNTAYVLTVSGYCG